mgnify:CR=1 FL=1
MMRMNSLRAAILAVCCVAGQGAHAQLFGDDQARQAILDLRQRFDQSVAAQNQLDLEAFRRRVVAEGTAKDLAAQGQITLQDGRDEAMLA